mgnify:CR=1 FL=1
MCQSNSKMKKIKGPGLVVFIFSLCLTQLTYSQNFNLKGQFTGPHLEKSFINVINTTQFTATISQQDGKFEIPVKIGDSILISSIQYKDVKFIVKPEFKTEPIQIPLQLKVTELENVDIYSTGLSGDLEKDAESIRLKEPIAMNFSLLDLANAYDPEIAAQSEFNLRNEAFEKTQPNLSTNFDFMMIGAMLVSLFKKKKDKSKATRNINNQDFVFTIEDAKTLSYYLNMEEKQMENFMTYAYQNGLEAFLKTNPGEMDLIQFLIELSTKYNQ